MKFIAYLLTAVSLTGCTYQGWVRYPCQEVKNWETEQCQHPTCDVYGTCPEDLLPEVFENAPQK